MKNAIRWSGKSEYNETIDPKTKELTHCDGSFMLYDIRFRFSAYRGGASGYALRGSVRILDPNTGYPLKQKRKGGRDCSCSFHIRYEDLPVKSDTIKAVVMEKAKLLYSRHIEDIRDASRSQSSSTDITLLYLFHVHKKAWMAKCRLIKTGSERSAANAEALLNDYFLYFEGQSVAAITGKDIEDVRKHFGEQAARAERLGSDFWQYCSAKHRIDRSVPNPFEAAAPAARKAHRKNPNAGRVTSLSGEQEAHLMEIIRERFLSNPLYVGICLIMDGGLTTTGIFELTWDRILFDETDPNLCCIRITGKMSSYATHDFTRPVFPFAAEILRAWRDHLLDHPDMNEEQLAMRRIMLGNKKRMKHTPSDLTRLCSKILPDAMVSYQDIDLVRKHGGRIGAGVTILQNTYQNKLAEICRMKQHDPDAYEYMQSNSLTGKTTADHYRSFSSWEGIRLLYTYLLRDTRFLPDSERECRVTDIPDPDGSTIKKVTGLPASCQVEVVLRNGESITVSSEARIRGTYRVKVVSWVDAAG